MKHPLRTASPTLRKIFTEIEDRGISFTEIKRKTKVHPNSMYGYRTGAHEPGIITVEILANALGYRVALLPLNEPANDGRADHVAQRS